MLNTEALLDLAGEVSDSETIKENSKEIRIRTNRLKSETKNLGYISNTTHSLLSGPDWSSKRIDKNIRATTSYIKRLKRVIARVALLGTSGAIALNTAETNVALNAVQKNQQTLMLQNQDYMLRSLEREKESANQWSSFINSQREIRNQRPFGEFHE